ncbi:MAG: ribosomal protein L13e [Candidatus Thorarchaeota archaeon]|nr:MAG: hypothetical protein DRO73_07660 [Candidatus Thorarchaeota archaeon]RLI61052.1 MAG: hypothetical protein DRO93_05380 [Candidatus Thorarchaeota archaeon]
MDAETTEVAMVRSPGDRRWREGRGFSLGELKAAGLTVSQARRMGLRVDLRRKTTHPENVEIVKSSMTG